MKQNKCSCCNAGGHNIRTCTVKSNYDSDMQKHYISTHPLSLFPDLMKEKMKIKKRNVDIEPVNIPSYEYYRLNFMHTLKYNIGVFRWNTVEHYRKWVSALTACRTPSTEYGPEHPVLLDSKYPLSYWIYLQKETETTLEIVQKLMKVARSYEIPVNRLLKSKLGNQFVNAVSKHCHQPLSEMICILVEMIHSLETQIKKIQNIIQYQTSLTKMVTKTNIDVVPLILSYM